jgi:flagellar biosynthetic protein FlhB
MAEEADNSQKTEAPSQRRLDEARQRGQLVVSREVTTFFLYTAAAILWLAMAGPSAARLTALGRTFLAEAHRLHLGAAPAAMVLSLLAEIGSILALPALALFLVPIAAAAVQNAIVWTSEPLQPKFERISPLAGARRLLSGRSLIELLKNLVKIIVVGAALALLLWPERQAILATAGLPAGPFLAYLGGLLFRVLVALAVLAAAVAVVDYGWQWFSFMRQMRMSREELREEHKQNEGDPHIRQRQRAIRMERARRRMMVDVPKATMVIANPTHFAVALRYVAGETPAPKVLAKGLDAVALRIRTVAEMHGVPVIENPPLARTLYAACDLGEFVPPAHYQAVAEVVSYVLRLSEQRRSS